MDTSYVNDSFAEVLPGRKNEEVFMEALEIQQLGDEVLERLRWIQLNISGCLWWTDKPLMDLFGDLYKSGCILLPKDGVERLRWLALLCLEFSNIYGYDCSGVILPFDFLEEEMFVIFESEYPASVIKKVKETRKMLEEQGWDATFGS